MELKKKSEQHILDLYQSVKNNNNMSFSTYILSLDWLYLIDVAKINEDGRVQLCS
ncbi:ABC-three component system middle component 6 [Metabacillus fastidiosus]|uniref:ABC-three component system middle component 6 n=1 Tax=Metabacillus fastidiosus TaxID=1458 RepID=UPI003D2C7C5C